MSKYKIAFAAVVIFFLVTAFYSLNTLFVYTPDSARYVAWANSLAQFNGFTDTTEPEAVRYCIHSPLYSLLLAPIVYFVPNNIVALKVLNVLLAAGTALFLFFLLRKESNEVIALIIASIFLLHPWTYFLSTQLLTEILFGFGFIALLYFLSEEWGENSKRYNFYVVLVSLLVCIFSREIGILLLPLVVGVYFLRKKYTQAIVIFFLPLILYIVWYIRNDVYYLGLEGPTMRNSTLFFSNVLTSMDASFLEELSLRISTNGAYYLKELSALLFFTSYNVFEESVYSPWISFVDVVMPAMVAISSIVKSMYWLLGMAGLGLVITGMVVEFRRGKKFYVKIAFLCLYGMVILVYPVFDARFLFPILLLFLLWVGYALHYFIQINIRFRSGLLFALIMLLSIPNIAWSLNFISTQYQLIDDPKGEFMDRRYPGTSFGYSGHVQVTLPLVADWLNVQNDSSYAVLTPYKELSFFLTNKRVRMLAGFTPLTFFNQAIRDYEIHYLVVLKDLNEWRDYEYQMGMNDLYSFTLVHSEGCFEVYEISRMTTEEPKQRLAGVVQKIKNGNYLSVDSFFVRNNAIMKTNPKLVILNMINKHFLEQLDSVQLLMKYLYTTPQGLIYARQASLHQTTIDRRKQLNRQLPSLLRANILLVIGTQYWELGMKKFALQYCRQSVEVDSHYALAYAYNIMLHLQEGDTVHAFSVFNKLQRNFPGTEYTLALDTLMQTYKVLNRVTKAKDKAAALEKLTAIYSSLELDDLAIECGRKGILFDAQRISLYKRLADLYERQHLCFVALGMINRYLAIAPNEPGIEAQVHRLKTKLYTE